MMTVEIIAHPFTWGAILSMLIFLRLGSRLWTSGLTRKKMKEKKMKGDPTVVFGVALDRKPGVWPPSDFVQPDPQPYPNWDVHTTKPLPYRPMRYGPNYYVTMGVRKMQWDEWIELDNQWLKFHNDKLARLREREESVILVHPKAEAAALELLDALARYLSKRYPSLFKIMSVEGKGRCMHIAETNETFPLENLSGHDAMRTAALFTQDDLALMVEDSDGKYYLRGGAFLLAGFWRVKDKFGMPLDEIHTSGDVPKFKEKLQTSMERFFLRLQPDSPVLRNNYFIQTDANLPWSSSIGSEDRFGIGWKNATVDPPIKEIHFRTERQSLRRLPKSGAVLFTVRTYFIPVEEISQEPHIPGRLASAIRSWPDDVSLYKGREAYEHVLLRYLDEQHQLQKDKGIVTSDQETQDYPY